jgi:1-acyl-sn-glycerol-3-phosphate acyltransferase
MPDAQILPLFPEEPDEPTAEAASPSSAPGGTDWDAVVARALAFTRRRLTGDYEVDDLGYDPELTDTVLMAALRPLAKEWFRVEVQGIEHVPAAGGALVVGNHSGTIALDAVMTQLAVLDNHPERRSLRILAGDLVFRTPVLSQLARAAGHTLACQADTELLLGRGELVGVWPEGYKGVGKPFSERYRLQRFGRGGFVAAALRAQVPIVPCAIVGAEETYPMIGDIKPLARLLGLPYFPVTPTFPLLGPLGAVPLPSKWLIAFGPPIDLDGYGPEAAEDPMVVFDLADQVRERIQTSIYQLLQQRPHAFG